MLETTLNFQQKIKQGKWPIPYLIVETDAGIRIISEKMLSNTFSTSISIADGSVIADGSMIAGGQLYLSMGSARLLSLSSINNAVQLSKFDALTSSTIKRQGSITVELDNLHESDATPTPFL